MPEEPLSEVVCAAADGDQQAWDALVHRFGALVWSVARAYRLSEADAADVSQTAWLRLAEHLHRLREPDRVGSWLAATARNEALRTLRRSSRYVPVEVDFDAAVVERAPSADRRLLREERDARLWKAFDALPDPCRRLLRALMADPVPSYAEVGAALGMPVGSIGPRRSRCLAGLRDCAEPEDLAVSDRVFGERVRA